MYIVTRQFQGVASVPEAAARAESGIIPLLTDTAGFRAYYAFDAGNGVGCSVAIFDTEEAAHEATRKAIDWIRTNLDDLVDGEMQMLEGEVLSSIVV